MFYFPQGLKRKYEAEVKNGISKYLVERPELLTEPDIALLPKPLQKYLHYVNVVGKPKIWNVRAIFQGKMKFDENKKWMNIKAKQYNFFQSPTRIFYIEGMLGVPIYGLHTYKEENGKMLIKLAGLITVADAKGPEATVSDTVTLFNDMCVFAPAALVQGNISWELLDELTVKGTFTNGGNMISAKLRFNEQGQLVNFISNDRYMYKSNGYQRLLWSTPIKEYKKYGDFMLPANASAVWHLPGREFKYAEFDLKEVEYNCALLK